MMAERATPEALRRAAELLAQACAVDDREIARDLCLAAYDTWPVQHAESPADEGILQLVDLSGWREFPTGMRWLAQAAQLRLLVEAAVAEGIPSKQGALEDVVWGWWQEVYRDG